MSKARLVLIGVVFIFSVAFFLWLLRTTVFKSQAAEEPVYIFFDKDTIKAADFQTTSGPAQIPVNVYFQTKPENKISAGSVQLKYDPAALTIQNANSGQVETTCKNNDQSLITQAKFTNDPIEGIITVSNVLLDNDNAKLPPHLSSGIFCLTTIYFQPKFNPLLSASNTTTVSLMSTPGSCEVVGPSQTYGCNFYSGKQSIVIELSNAGPTLTPIVTPTGYSCKYDSDCPQPACAAPTYSFPGLCKASKCVNGFCQLVDIVPQPQQLITMPPPASPSATPVLTQVQTGGASYKFVPNSVTGNLANNIEVKVDVDSGKYKLVGADLFLKYDPTKLKVEQVKGGNFFEFTTSDISVAGSAYIVGVVTNLDQMKTGRGTLAMLVIKPLALGNTTMTVACSPGTTSDSNIVDGNAADVIDCSLNESVNVAITSGIGVTPAVTVIPSTTTPAPTSNACLKKVSGDCNCSDNIDIIDFELWRKEYAKESATFVCDFNMDKAINLTDFNIWRVGYFKDKAQAVTPTVPTVTGLATPSATLPTGQPVSTPTGSMVILRQDEI